jgi:hypothetical protein
MHLAIGRSVAALAAALPGVASGALAQDAGPAAVAEGPSHA